MSESGCAHPDEKREADWRYHPWAALVFRPIGLRLAPGLVRIGFSATHVTWIGFGIGLFGVVLLAANPHNYAVAILGCVLLNLWQLADFTDGPVALP